MRINHIPLIMLYCLGSTIVIEGVLAFLWGLRSRSQQLIVLLANVMTNPLLVSLVYAITFRFGAGAYNIATAILETLVVLAEGFVYKRMLPEQKHPFALSLFCNASSFLIGVGLNALIF